MCTLDDAGVCIGSVCTLDDKGVCIGFVCTLDNAGVFMYICTMTVIYWKRAHC